MILLVILWGRMREGCVGSWLTDFAQVINGLRRMWSKELISILSIWNVNLGNLKVTGISLSQKGLYLHRDYITVTEREILCLLITFLRPTSTLFFRTQKSKKSKLFSFWFSNKFFILHFLLPQRVRNSKWPNIQQ